jgi:hypothetical protein
MEVQTLYSEKRPLAPDRIAEVEHRLGGRE